MACSLRMAARSAASTLTLCIISAGCSDDAAAPADRTFRGPQVAVGSGMAWSEMVFGSADDLKGLSVVFTPGALTNLPATLPATEFIIPMPTQAPSSVYDHIGINYQPQGHPPPMVYTVPHFDVHYYLVSMSARDAMTPADPAFASKLQRLPTSDETPPSYAGDPQGIPRMGTHWTDQTSHEFHGNAFTNTLVYGFYDGRMVFIEPMITKAFLESRPDETRAIKVPTKYPAPGRYPTSYRVWFDAATQQYRVDLGEFVTRS